MSITDIIDLYCKAWSEPDAALREQYLRAVVAPEGIYSDPSVELEGVQALHAHIARVLARRPGSAVLRTTQVDEHHDMCRFEWCVVDGAGHRTLQGTDVARLHEGRMVRIVGFFGPLAAR